MVFLSKSEIARAASSSSARTTIANPEFLPAYISIVMSFFEILNPSKNSITVFLLAAQGRPLSLTLRSTFSSVTAVLQLTFLFSGSKFS